MSAEVSASEPSETVRSRAFGEPILTVSGLSVEYGAGGEALRAVSDVSLQLHRGEIMAVIGESGSGKTTLARAILRLLPPNGRVTSGVVELGGAQRELLHARGAALRSLRGAVIGYVPQATAGALNPVQRVHQHFRVTLRAHGMPGGSSGHARAEKALADAGLADTRAALHAYPHELSGGMAQRVVVALATVLEPSVLVADEPTSALDVTVQRRLLDNLAADVRRHQRGAIIITHDIGIAGRYCDSVLVMFGGCAVESGPKSSVLGQPRHPYTRTLLEAVPGQHRGRTMAARDNELQAEPRTGTQVCPFYVRCPNRADPRCESESPPWREVGPDHFVRSFYG